MVVLGVVLYQRSVACKRVGCVGRIKGVESEQPPMGDLALGSGFRGESRV